MRSSVSDLDQPTQASKLALRSLARRIQQLDLEIADLDEQLMTLVARATPRTPSFWASAPATPASCWSPRARTSNACAARARSLRSAASARNPASSGRTTPHHLSYGGDRAANRALHMIAVCRLHYCTRPQAYAARRTRKGKTKREIIRCPKRYIAREAYHALQADLASLRALPTPRPRHTIAITCATGFIGRHRQHLDP